jgi:transcription initiation factor TFIIA large subunit
MSTTAFYKHVIEDVIEKMQEEFVNAGVDESVLSDLRNLWQSKIASSRALIHETSTSREGYPMSRPYPPQQQPGYMDPSMLFSISNAHPNMQGPPHVQYQGPSHPSQYRGNPAHPQQHYGGQIPHQQHPQTNANNYVHPENYDSSATNPATSNISNDLEIMNEFLNRDSRNHPPQYDGQDDDDEDEEEDEEEESEEDEDQDNKGGEDNLGSDLDDEEDDVEEGSYPNMVLCQYEKVHRTKNRWKCQFKDGIANINGKDYVFLRCQADFEF